MLDSYGGELDGTPDNDLLIGNGLDEMFRTGNGSDTVDAGDGNNVVWGDDGLMSLRPVAETTSFMPARAAAISPQAPVMT